jgi:hypothetical protein
MLITILHYCVSAAHIKKKHLKGSDKDPSFWVLESVLVSYFGFSVALYEGLENWPSNAENTEWSLEGGGGGGIGDRCRDRIDKQRKRNLKRQDQKEYRHGTTIVTKINLPWLSLTLICQLTQPQ